MSKIDSLTIGDAREIAALFGAVAAPQAPASLAAGMVGKRVVVRSSPSGVHHGTLVAASGRDVLLADARRAWSWRGAASCSGLALSGPTDGLIAPPVESIVVADCCEIIVATAAASARWDAAPRWTIT